MSARSVSPESPPPPPLERDAEPAAPPAPPGSVFALSVLVAMAVLTPWAFGGAPAAVIRFLTLTSLLVSLAILALQMRANHVEAPPPLLWPLFGAVILGYLQLIPLPPAVLDAVAPGPASLWHPLDPVVRDVLGGEWRPVSIHPAATRSSAAWGLGLLTLASLSAPVLHQRQARRAALIAIAVGGVAVAVYGVVARVTFGPLLYGRFTVPTVMPFGPFVSKNHFAGFLAMAALLTLGLALPRRRSYRGSEPRLWWVSRRGAGGVVSAGGAAALMMLAILASQSRGGVVALVAGALVFWRLGSRGSGLGRGAVLAAVFLVSLGVALWTILPSDAWVRLRTLWGPPDPSRVYRLALWRDTLRVAASSPGLGYGFGTFADALPRFKSGAVVLQVEHAENDFLELVAEGGWVGAAAVALAGWMVVRRLAHPGHDEPLRALTPEVVGAAAAVAALLCHSAFDFNLRLGAPAALGSLSVAVLASAWPRPARRVPLRGAAVALMILSSSALFLIGSAPRRPRTSLGPGAPVRTRLEADTRVAYLRSRPADATAWVQLAWLRFTQGRVEDALAIVNHARRLDPGRPDLQEYARRLSQVAGRAVDLP